MLPAASQAAEKSVVEGRGKIRTDLRNCHSHHGEQSAATNPRTCEDIVNQQRLRRPSANFSNDVLNLGTCIFRHVAYGIDYNIV